MSMPPINPFAGLAATGSDDRRQVQQEREQRRAQDKVEAKAGADSEMPATEASSDRDADGRQMPSSQEQSHKNEDRENEAQSPPLQTNKSIDLEKSRGNQIDLEG